MALYVLNTLVIAAVALFFVLGLVYGRPGSWGVGDAVGLAILLVPFVATLVALRERSPSVRRSFARSCNAGWAAVLALLGIGASTGIGGAFGLLLVIPPGLLVLVMNWRALRIRKDPEVEA